MLRHTGEPRVAARLVLYRSPSTARLRVTICCIIAAMVGQGTLNFSRSSRHLSSLYEPRMRKEKAMVSAFHPGRSLAIFSLRGAYRSSLYASVLACQSPAQSFGRVTFRM